ncbi:hypothetical protein BJX70DRAFT_374126 [Aspergillus crustosus]
MATSGPPTYVFCSSTQQEAALDRGPIMPWVLSRLPKAGTMKPTESAFVRDFPTEFDSSNLFSRWISYDPALDLLLVRIGEPERDTCIIWRASPGLRRAVPMVVLNVLPALSCLPAPWGNIWTKPRCGTPRPIPLKTGYTGAQNKWLLRKTMTRFSVTRTVMC